MTPLDVHNARLYAYEHLKKLKYQSFLNSHPHIFRHVVVKERPATNEDYFVPPALPSADCFVFDSEFEEAGCRKVGCFPFKEKAEPCKAGDQTRGLRYGNSVVFGCQPACFTLYPENLVLDTAFRDGRCEIDNHLLKLIALNPGGHGTLDVDLKKDELFIPDDYCKTFGLALRDGECVETAAQKAGEVFVGSTIYRSLNVKLSPPASLPPPTVPSDIASLRAFRKIRATPTIFKSTSGTGQLVDKQLLKDIALELALDNSASWSASKLSQVLRNTVPRASKNVGAVAALLKHRAAVSVIRGVGTAVAAASVVFDIFAVVTMIVDMVDPGGFFKYVSKAEVDQLSADCRARFRYYYGERPTATPNLVISLLEEKVAERESVLLFLERKVADYLGALDVNSAGQRLAIQQEQLREALARQQRRQRERKPDLFFFVVTTAFLILSFLSPLTSVGYLYFIAAYYYFKDEKGRWERT